MRIFGAHRGYIFLNSYISKIIKMMIAKGPKAAKKVLSLYIEPYPPSSRRIFLEVGLCIHNKIMTSIIKLQWVIVLHLIIEILYISIDTQVYYYWALIF